jgi:DNA-binding CsgD family transcriptional regulator
MTFHADREARIKSLARSYLKGHMSPRSLKFMKSFTAVSENLTFTSVLEGLLDAILISDIQGEVLYTNLSAQKICHQLQLGHLQNHAIWSICELLKSQADRDLILESELMIAEIQYRIRVQWLNTHAAQDDRLIVRFENQQHSMRCAAMFESQWFGLTTREAEVWELRSQGKSRREIADQLFISIDTVKKHLANIKMKRDNHLNQGVYNRLSSPSL